MAVLPETGIRDLEDLRRFESEMTLEERLPERSILDVFIARALDQPDRTAITMLMTGAPDEEPRRVSYRELLGLVRRAANLFATLAGPRPGVAYMLPSLVETHATLWGAEAAGYAVPINFLLQPEHIAGLLKASGARILVALGPHPVLDIWQKALALRDAVPGLQLVRVAPPGIPVEPGVIDFHTALMAQPDDRLVFGDPGRDGDIAAYFHTGGTTGAPKLVAHTHRSQLVAALGGAVLGDMRPTDTLTATLPLFHVGGTIFCGLSAFMAGIGLLVMSPGGLRNPAMVQGYWRLAARYGATLVGAVPTSIGAVLEVPLDGADLSAARAGFCGAASLPTAVRERFRQVVGIGLFEVYGMTEASGLIAIDPVAGEGGAGSVGWALPYTRVEVRRLEANGRLGPVCAPGEIGVITARGPHVSPGYRNPEHDAGVFDDGLLNSGDLGYADARGRIYIAGRAKDLIIRSGHNIDPLMIENAMAAHPAVALAAAVAMPDAYAGELPVCYVALRPGATATEEELREHAEQSIGERPAWPKQICIVDAIPLTSVGKIYKPQLRCDAASRLVTHVVHDRLGLRDAQIRVQEGGRRGMRVTVDLPDAARSAVPTVEDALAVYLFETRVTAG
ncbi:AMP-binding protein [Variovorax sp. YR216]|uniref:AMP-binding protein n=1 Tax=Variovorax sp. YR216 TaxID=1882828 RepID=UPI000894DE11|nr:AMP-binding protein [Variovorax sp. YR216]SEA21291.1 fatty-acyl-CoA synthase [Variovorax sp. YR216]